MTSMKQQPTILVEGNQVIIENFQTDDYEIVSYFEDLAKSDEYEQKLENALKTGIVAIKSVGIAKNINYVEKAFDNLDEKMKRELESAFSKDGKFSGILKEHFGEDGKIIKEYFDPNKENSPLHTLRTDIERSLSQIRDQLVMNVGKDAVIEKSPQKGHNFEDECEKKLEEIARIHSDKLERTGNMAGKISGSKKGDFVLTLGDIDEKIVFEMKDRDKISQSSILKEMKDAMENREASYGIFVVRKKNILPESIGWFNEYDGNQLVCAVENDDGDSLIDGEIIHIAYKWARAKLRIKSAKEKTLDPAFIMEKVDVIKNKIGDMKKIKRQCKNIEESTVLIKDTAKITENEIKNELDEIMESLNPEDK